MLAYSTLAVGQTTGRSVRFHIVQENMDQQVTNEYFAAVRVYLRSIENHIGTVGRSVDEVVTSVGHCPDVAVDAPSSFSRSSIETDIPELVAIAAAHGGAASVSHLRSRVDHLRWSDSHITDLIQMRLRVVSMQAHLKMPHICRDLRKWASGWFMRVPLELAKFGNMADALSEADDILPGVVEQYGQPRILGGIRRLQFTVARDLGVRVNDGRIEVCKMIGLGCR